MLFALENRMQVLEFCMFHCEVRLLVLCRYPNSYSTKLFCDQQGYNNDQTPLKAVLGAKTPLVLVYPII